MKNPSVKIVPVVKQRHAKVVVSSRRYPRKKTVACIRPGIVSAGGSLRREDSMKKYRRRGRRALLLLFGVSVSVAVLVVCRGQLEKRSCWYVTGNNFCVASYMTCSLLLIAD